MVRRHDDLANFLLYVFRIYAEGIPSRQFTIRFSPSIFPLWPFEFSVPPVFVLHGASIAFLPRPLYLIPFQPLFQQPELLP